MNNLSDCELEKLIEMVVYEIAFRPERNFKNWLDFMFNEFDEVFNYKYAINSV